MENLENGLGGLNSNGVENAGGYTPAAVPAPITKWSKFRSYMCQEITITMTPKQEKVLKEVHDFWHQEITGKKIHDFLFQEIKIIDNITL